MSSDLYLLVFPILSQSVCRLAQLGSFRTRTCLAGLGLETLERTAQGINERADTLSRYKMREALLCRILTKFFA